MLTRTFPGVYASLADIAEFVKTSTKEIGFNPTEIFALETAVDEAVSNIIEHAYEGEGKGDIICSIEIKPTEITIVMEDHGKSFDPSCIPVPDLSADLDDRMEHGLGYYMMCQLLDDVKFDFTGQSNRLTMVKKRAIPEKEKKETISSLPWQRFQDFSEELLNQPDTKSLCDWFNGIIEKQFSCDAHLWLAEPFYPLPGEPDMQTLPGAIVPELVRDVWDRKNRNPQNTLEIQKNDKVNELAVPVVTQNFLLGILHLKREGKRPFEENEIEELSGLITVAAGSMQINRQVALKNWRFDQISLVRSVSSQISSVLNLDELCKRVTNLIQCSFNYYHVGIYTIEENSEFLNFRASSLDCVANTIDPLNNVRLGVGLVGKVANTGKEIIASNVTDEPEYRFTEALPNTKAEAVLPLIIENRILGVLDIQSEILGVFHENDMLVLRSLADNIALAVENARLFSDLERKADQILAVSEINFALSSILDLDKLLQEVVDVIHTRFSIPQVFIYTVHMGRRKIIFQAGSSKHSEKLRSNAFAYDLDAPQGMIPNVARTGKAMLVNDVALEPLFKPSKKRPQETKSEMTIPLKFSEDVLGILDLQSDFPGAFTQRDLNLFSGLASGIALSIRNATLFRSEKWRSLVADSFKDVASLLSANIALDELLNRILSELEKILPCDSSAIWLLDDASRSQLDTQSLQLAAVRGTSRNKIVDSCQKSDAVYKFLFSAIKSKKLQIRKPTDPFGPLGKACGFEKNYSSLAVPLLASNEVIGVLTLAHHNQDQYGSEASSIASTFASYAAVAIENARLYSNAQEDAWSSTVLLQVAEALQSINTVDELLSTMVRLTPLLVGINQCAFYLFNSLDSCFELKTWYGFTPSEDENKIRDDQSFPILKMQATLAPVFIENPEKDLGISSINKDDNHSTMVLVPLVSHGEILGAFFISHNSTGEFGIRNRFSDQTLAILQGIAQQSSIALENIHLNESRQEEAYITAVLLQVAQAVVSQNNLEDILDTIVHLMPILVGVDTCAVYLWDSKKSNIFISNVMAPTHTEIQNSLRRSFLPGEFPLLDTILTKDSQVVYPIVDSSVRISDWINLQSTDFSETSAKEYSDCVLGFPLSIKGVVYGALIAQERNIQPAFHKKRIELMRGVAQQIALAIQNEHLKEETVDRERMEKEFQLARAIQKSFLPKTIPELEGWEFTIRWQTAREVGGDFYDFFITKNHKVAIVIADVADKGMPAALYMTVTSTLIRANALSNATPSKVLEKVNEQLVKDSQNGMFVTAFFGLLDPKTGILEYSNAGHNLPLLLRPCRKWIEKLKKGNIALGVLEDAVYENHQIEMDRGDKLLLYTDGVTEAFSSKGEIFSEDRLIQHLLSKKIESAEEFLSVIIDTIQKFRDGEPPSDDLTMVAVHRKE